MRIDGRGMVDSTLTGVTGAKVGQWCDVQGKRSVTIQVLVSGGGAATVDLEGGMDCEQSSAMGAVLHAACPTGASAYSYSNTYPFVRANVKAVTGSITRIVLYAHDGRNASD